MDQAESPQAKDDSRTREFLRLLGENDQSLRRYVFTLVPHWADSQDLVQEVQLRLWDQFDQYDPEKDFGAWARTIAYYLVLAHRERKSRRKNTSYLSTEVLETVAAEAAQCAETTNARGDALRNCINKLATHAQRLLMRCYEGQETLHQIAESLGRSYEATRKSVFRIRTSLAKCIDETLKEETS